MAESTLSVDFFRIFRELARQIGTGRTYGTGTVAISSGVATLTGGTLPSWVGTGAVYVNGSVYDIRIRNSNTQFTLTDTSVAVSSGAAYVILETTEDDTESVLQDHLDWIDAGYHEFLYPDVMQESQLVWSFLIQDGTISASASDSAYDLPDAFGQHLVSATLVSADSDDATRLAIISRRELAEKQNAESTVEGAPEYVAWRPKAFAAATGERFELLVHPTPDGSYSIRIEFRTQPDRLAPAAPYPRGGMLHSDTILKACRAAAERDQDDESGIHNQRFQQRLQASVMMDAAIRAEVGYATNV